MAAAGGNQAPTIFLNQTKNLVDFHDQRIAAVLLKNALASLNRESGLQRGHEPAREVLVVQQFHAVVAMRTSWDSHSVA